MAVYYAVGNDLWCRPQVVKHLSSEHNYLYVTINLLPRKRIVIHLLVLPTTDNNKLRGQYDQSNVAAML
jgi:hypothetical protein